MATELVTFKMEKKFLQEVDASAKASGYHSRTEFIREALRAKMDDAKIKEVMKQLAPLKGMLKKGKHTTNEELHRIREQVAQEMFKHIK